MDCNCLKALIEPMNENEYHCNVWMTLIICGTILIIFGLMMRTYYLALKSKQKFADKRYNSDLEEQLKAKDKEKQDGISRAESKYNKDLADYKKITRI